LTGHGGQTADLDGDEEDGTDEVIYPVDFKTNGHIVDDEIHLHVVKPLQAGVRLTAIFDSCHSGSVMDLPYMYSTKGVLKEPNLAKEAGAGLLSAFTAYSRGDMGGVATSVFGLAKAAFSGGSEAHEQTKRTKTSPADVIMWSGCKDVQTSLVSTSKSKSQANQCSVPTRPSPPRLPVPCHGPSSRPSPRTPSRLMLSYSTASAIYSRPTTRKSPSCRAVILSVCCLSGLAGGIGADAMLPLQTPISCLSCR